MSKDQLISVIVPCARPERAKATIEALLQQDFPAGKYELIIVVPDESAASAIRAPRIDVVIAGRLFPPGKMRNIGVKASTGRYLGFVDDDCIPPDNWLAVMVAALREDSRCAALSCRLVSASSGFWNECADFALFWPYQYPAKRKTDIGSAAIAVKREAFQEAGGFDEKLRATEDWDFCLRIRAMGWHSIHDPAVAVLHDHRRGSLAAIVKQGYNSGYLSGLDVQRKHASQMTWLGRLSLLMGDPKLYWLLILPNSCLNTILQVLPFLKTRPKVAAFSPFIFLARFAYHIGVWRRLLEDRRDRQESRG